MGIVNILAIILYFYFFIMGSIAVTWYMAVVLLRYLRNGKKNGGDHAS